MSIKSVSTQIVLRLKQANKRDPSQEGRKHKRQVRRGFHWTRLWHFSQAKVQSKRGRPGLQIAGRPEERGG